MGSIVGLDGWACLLSLPFQLASPFIASGRTDNGPSAHSSSVLSQSHSPSILTSSFLSGVCTVAGRWDRPWNYCGTRDGGGTPVGRRGSLPRTSETWVRGVTAGWVSGERARTVLWSVRKARRKANFLISSGEEKAEAEEENDHNRGRWESRTRIEWGAGANGVAQA